jgi:hypothetical protein
MGGDIIIFVIVIIIVFIVCTRHKKGIETPERGTKPNRRNVE